MNLFNVYDDRTGKLVWTVSAKNEEAAEVIASAQTGINKGFLEARLTSDGQPLSVLGEDQVHDDGIPDDFGTDPDVPEWERE